MVSKKRLYKFPRYWYHVSGTLKDDLVHLDPKDDCSNRSIEEPDGARICVAPTIEQCITALPYIPYKTYYIYRTATRMCAAKPPVGAIFDGNITDEGWIKVPTVFIKIGTLDFNYITEYLMEDNKDIISDSASGGDLTYCKEVLRWWKRLKIKRFITPA